MKPTRLWLAPLTAAALIVALTACSGSNETVGGSSGNVRVTLGAAAGTTAAMTDSGGSAVAKAEITVSAVRARATDGTWFELSGALPMTIDVLALAGPDGVSLASGSLPAGTYDRLEITITGASIQLSDGTTVTLTLPSSGVTVSVAVSFEVVDGQPIVIKLGIRAEASFEFAANGGVSFKPEIELEGVGRD